MFRKKTFTGLSTNCFSFISYSFTPGLIRTLVDRAYKINNTWLGFHENIKRLTKILKKNLFPAHLVERAVNRYLTPVSVSVTTPTFYNKLLYIGPLSVVTEQRVWHLARRYCNNIDIKLVFPSFRVGNMFGEKDAIPLGLRACVVYKFFRPYFHYHLSSFYNCEDRLYIPVHIHDIHTFTFIYHKLILEKTTMIISTSHLGLPSSTGFLKLKIQMNS